MKQFIIIILSFILFSCDEYNTLYRYKVELTYHTGRRDTIVFTSSLSRDALDQQHSCLVLNKGFYNREVACGMSYYRVIECKQLSQ